MFVAGLAVVVDMKTGKCVLSNSGVPHPLYVKSGNNVERIPANGLLLGIADSTLFSPSEEYTIELVKGESLLLYTDGISEAENAGGDFFEDRMQVILADNGKPVDHALDSLISAAKNFAAEDFTWDDITMVCIEKTQ
jgi:sigma-B regulation protein RsbU (phosphoserine phosphatase)